MNKKLKTLEKIKSLLRKLKPELEQIYKVKEIGVFGSWIRDMQKKNSDLDILVEFEKASGITLLDFIDMEIYLSEKIGIKVDLVEKSSLKPYIRENILREVIYL